MCVHRRGPDCQYKLDCDLLPSTVFQAPAGGNRRLLLPDVLLHHLSPND